MVSGAPRDRVRDRPFAYRLRLFAVSLVVAVAIELVVHWLHEADYLAKVEDIGADIFVAMQRDRVLADDSRPFSLINIDDAAYEDWGEPLPLPRDRIAALVGAAAAGGAAMIVVDIALSDRVAADALAPAEAQLADALADAAATGTPVILHRDIDVTPGDPGFAIPEVNPSFLEELVAATANLYWASSLFDRSADWVVRRWRLWQAACIDGRAEIVPSVQLVAWLIETGGTGPAKDGLSLLNALAPEDCAVPATPMTTTELRVGGATINLRPGAVESRVLFAIPWQPERSFSRMQVERAGGPVPLLETIPAAALAAGEPVGPDLFRDRIVVIGGSFGEARDMHLTPIGAMPGALMLINAMHTVLSVGVLEPPHGGLKWAIIFGQIAAAAALFYFLPARRAAWIGVAVVFLSFFWFSQIFLKTGVWIDATLGMVGVLAHRFVAGIEHRVTGAARRTWRAARRLGNGAACIAVALGVAMLASATLPAAADGDAIAGRIDWFDGRHDQLFIERQDGRIEPIALFARLFAGDRVIVDDMAGSVRISLVDGSAATVAADSSPYLVGPVTASQAEPAGNFLELLGRMLTPWRIEEVSAVSARSRGIAGFAVPLVEGVPAKVERGDRTLTIVWSGGKPPFRVRASRLEDDGRSTVLAEGAPQTDRRAGLGPMRLEEDRRYRLEVEDADGNTIGGEIVAAPVDAVPHFSEVETTSRIMTPLEEISRAAALAAYGDGEWRYEGYLRMVALAEIYPAARLLRDMLASGERPDF